MVHIVVKDNSKAAKEFLSAIKSFSFVEFVDEKPKYNVDTMKALAEAREGRINGTNIKTKDNEELFKSLRS